MELLLFILIVVLVVVKAVVPHKRQMPRFHQALWAESVRQRGLSWEEAEKEAIVLGLIDAPK